MSGDHAEQEELPNDPRGVFVKIETTDKINALEEMRENFYRLYEDIMGKYAEEAVRIIYEFQRLGYTLVQTNAVIAGFGFTAITAVKHPWLFVSGELILLLSMVYGVYSIKRIYEENYNKITVRINKLSVPLDEKSNIFHEMYDEWMRTGGIHGPYFFEKLQVADAKLTDLFKSEDLKSIDKKNYLQVLIFASLIGGALIIFSVLSLHITLGLL